MKLFSCFLVLWSYGNILIAADPTIHFSQNRITVKEERKGVSNIVVKVKLVGKLTKDVIVKVDELSNGTADNSNVSDYVLITKEIYFKQSEENTEKDLFIQINGDTLTEKIESIVLQLLSTEPGIISPTQSIILIEIENAASDEYTPYAKVFIGSNFDFFDGVSANNLYSELNIFIPDAIKTLGFYTGLYQNKSVSWDSANNRTYVFEINNAMVPETDSIRHTYKITSKTELRNLGLYFSPTVKLIGNSKFNLYGAFHLEIIQRRFSIENTKYELLQADTFKGNGKGISFTPELPKIKAENRYDTYWGLGLPMKLNTNLLELSTIPIWGFANITTSINPLSGNANSNWVMFYGFQFYAIESNSGISLGGEVRGYYGQKSAIVTVNLSKSFSLKKISDFIIKRN